MSCRVVLRAALALLVTAAQVTGTAATTGSVQRPDAAIYFCCCVGECSCTGDCCNHAPETDTDDEFPTTRIGEAGPTLEAPRSCGVWRATLQRGPDQGKVIVDDRGGRSTVLPAASRLQQSQNFLLVSLDEGLQPSSARAPPSLSARI
jgi:hypothetical protein